MFGVMGSRIVVMVKVGGSKVRRVGEGGIVDGINWIGVDTP